MRAKHNPFAVLAALALAWACMAGLPAAAATSVNFGVPEWPGEQVKADVASEILSTLGYDTKITHVSWIIGLRSVASGELSADMAIWRPTQDSVVKPMLDKGELLQLTTNIEDALYGIVVPDYVWDAGVHSIADLAANADKFEHKIYGIEAGNDGNDLVQDAIDNDQYGLKDFQLVESSEAGMLSVAGEAIKNEDWVVFLGWRPHWMNIIYDLKYLDDPELMWGGGSTVNTVVRPDYPDEHPNVARFLKQMNISSDAQSQWIYDYGYKEEDSQDVARRWMADNMDVIAEWLDGVTTADGKDDAIDLIREKFGQ